MRRTCWICGAKSKHLLRDRLKWICSECQSKQIQQEMDEFEREEEERENEDLGS